MIRFLLVFIPIIAVIGFHITLWWLDVTLQNRGLKKANSRINQYKDLSLLLDLIWEKDNPKLKQYQIAFGILISSVTLFFGFGLMIIVGFTHENQDCEFYKNYLQQDIQGRVDSLYIDYNNHTIETIRLKNGRTNTQFFRYRRDLFDFLEEGDSIIKYRSSPNLLVIRSGELFFFEVDKSHYCDQD